MIDHDYKEKYKETLLNKEDDKEYIRTMSELYNSSGDEIILNELLKRFYEPKYLEYKKIYDKNRDTCLKNEVLIHELCEFEDIKEKILLITDYDLIYISNKKIIKTAIKSLDYTELSQAAIVKNHIKKDDLILLEKNTCHKDLHPQTLEYPLYLLYTEEILHVLFQLEDMSELISNIRIVWLLYGFKFKEYFKDVQTMLPSLILGLSEEESNMLDEYLLMRLKQKENAIEAYTKYYSENSENIINNIKNGKPKVMVLTEFCNIVSSDFKPIKELDLDNAGGHAINSFRALKDIGCDVLFISGRSKIKRKDIDFYIKLNEFRPDIIVSILDWNFGFLRFLNENIPKEIIYVTWIQDALPYVMNQKTPYKLGRRDFILNHYISWKDFLDLGYKKYNLIDAPIPGNDKVYKPYKLTEEEMAAYSCDVCVFGSMITVNDKFAEQLIIEYENEDFVRVILEIIKKYKEDIYKENIKCEKEEIRGYFKKEIEDRGIVIYDDKLYEDIEESLFIVVSSNGYRMSLIDWLLDNGYTNIKVWGFGVDQLKSNPKYSKYIMGMAPNGEILSKILQASKIVIGNNIHTTSAARVWETMLSKGFYMSNYIPPEHDAVDLRLILRENEEFVMFHNKKELLEKIDYYLSHEEERQKMIEIGYKRAKELMTFEALMKKMLKEISERL